jgi:uncharacterized membrane protein YhiD involved in acid resistance
MIDGTVIDAAFTALQWNEFTRSAMRLLAAITLGAAIGWERERRHRWAGLRSTSSLPFTVVVLQASRLLERSEGEREP